MPISQNNTQVNSQGGMSNPDETAAVLSFATNLSQQSMPKAPQVQEIGAPSVPNQQNDIQPTQDNKADLEANNKEVEKMIDSKFDDFKKELKKEIKEQISGIKDSIQEALEEDDKQK